MSKFNKIFAGIMLTFSLAAHAGEAPTIALQQAGAAVTPSRGTIIARNVLRIKGEPSTYQAALRAPGAVRSVATGLVTVPSTIDGIPVLLTIDSTGSVVDVRRQK